MSPEARAGFTLLEVLVALAVFSLAALALVNVTGGGARSQARVESRTLGEIVADNIAIEALVAPPPLASGRSKGAVVAAGRDWTWTREIAPTGNPDLRRIVVEVRFGGELAADRTVYRRGR